MRNEPSRLPRWMRITLLVLGLAGLLALVVAYVLLASLNGAAPAPASALGINRYWIYLAQGLLLITLFVTVRLFTLSKRSRAASLATLGLICGILLLFRLLGEGWTAVTLGLAVVAAIFLIAASILKLFSMRPKPEAHTLDH